MLSVKNKIEYERPKKREANQQSKIIKMLQNQDFNRNTIVFINIVFCIILYEILLLEFSLFE